MHAHVRSLRRRLPVSLAVALSVVVSLSALLATIVGPGGLLRPSAVRAATIPGLPPNGEGTPPVSFQGGWVQHHPRVYFVFWGPKWLPGPTQDPTHIDVKARLEQLFQDLPGSYYNNILTQYSNKTSDPNGHVHNDVQFLDAHAHPQSVVDPRVPPANVDLITDVSTEAQWGFSQFGLSADKNIQVLVFPQQGTDYLSVFGKLDPFCGIHYYTDTNTLAYGLVRFASDKSRCNPTDSAAYGGVVGDMAWWATHEYAEIATDPHIFLSSTLYPHVAGSGWNTGTPFIPPLPPPQLWTPKEVADLCEDYSVGSAGAPNPYPTYLGYILPYLWGQWSADHDNNKGCIQQAGQDFHSPDGVAPYRHKHTVQGGILAKYQTTGFMTLLGEPLTEETPLPGGAVSYFAGQGGQACNGGYTVPTYSSISQEGGYGQISGAAIYASALGTYEVHSCIFHEYTAVMGGARGPLSFPIADEMGVTGGRVSYFAGQVCNGGASNGSGSAIYASSAGTHEVHGCIYHEYAAVMGGPTGWLGFPVTDETDLAGARVSYFKGNGQLVCQYHGPSGSSGAIYASSAGTHEVHSCLFDDYRAVNGPSGVLGFPLSDTQAIAGGNVNYFRGNGNLVCQYNGPSGSSGAVYWSSATGAHEVHSCLFDDYRAVNGPSGVLGFPTSDVQGVSGGFVSRFYGDGGCGRGGPAGSSGAIYWSSATNAHEVHGCIYQTYMNLGGSGSRLGFPTTDEQGYSGGRVSNFEHGYITADSTGIHVVYDCTGAGCI